MSDEHGAARGRRHRWVAVAQRLLLATIVIASAPGEGAAEQASQPGSAAAAALDVGRYHSCAVLAGGSVRCWGYSGEGQLGYASTATIGDDESPRAVGPVDLGRGRTATAISAGDFHTCALLDDGNVRCWGFGGNGRLGYASTQSVGDDESPGSVAPVDLGEGRTATAISAGLGHTCALLDDGSVRCWGYGENGALGYGNAVSIGDDEAPGSVGPVDLGAGRSATAISAGGDFTCALLDDRNVRCWGLGLDGRLGYGDTLRVGEDETPGSVGPVDLGPQRTARAISAGARGTCALLDNATLRCWGEGREGALGYGNGRYVGDNETPGAVGPVDLGSGRSARSISAGRHTCAVLDVGSVRCWGASTKGQLGYGNTERVGDDETPAAVAPVDVGADRTATAISAGELHTCARLDDDSVRCWGHGAYGRLGLCDERDIGDDESPASVQPVDLGLPGIVAAVCPVARPPSDGGGAAPAHPPAAAPSRGAGALPPDPLQAARAAEKSRAAALRTCLRGVTSPRRGARRPPRRLPSSRRSARRQPDTRKRRECLRRHSRIPGRVIRVSAQPAGAGKIRLTFRAVGTNGFGPPAARRYVIKQSPRPIRTARDFARAPSLCNGSCSFDVSRVGATATLTVTDLRRRRPYYYAIAARDNVSARTGPRSRTIRVRAG